MADYKKYKVGITVKEPWAYDISYEVLDYTLWRVQDGGDGCGYIALKDNIGVTPNTDPLTWAKATQAGQSIYDLAVKYHHFVGTEEEFEQQYQNALAAANTAASEASATNREVQAAEGLRLAAEQGRVNAESGRVSAESGRVGAESGRVNAESGRVGAESGRVSAESDRVNAESGRVSAENGRVLAENGRAGAESGRVSEWGGLKTDVNTSIWQSDAAASRANAAAAHAAPYIGENGHWYRWDTTTSAYVDTGEKAVAPVLTADNDGVIYADGTQLTDVLKTTAAAELAQEGTSESASGDGTRWGAYKTAEASRDTAAQAAEGTSESAAGASNRWGAYKTAEASRDTARQTAEGNSSSVAGDGSRWGAYKTAEAARDTAAASAEGTSSASAGDANRWGAYKTAENSRDAARLAAEGTSSSEAGDGSRWGAYKTAEAERSAAMNAKAEKDTDAVEGNLAKFDSRGNPVDAGYSAARIHRDLGYNATQRTIVLSAGVTGKYVKCSTRAATANANFNISAPFDVEACSELLIKTGFNPSDQDHAALDISIIAIYEEMERTRTVQAKNDQNQPLYYEVDEDGNPTSEQTTEVTPYPVYTTETYTESRYLPNNEDRFVAIPDSGYYVANIPQSCKCVISYKPGVTDLNVIVVKHGALANLTSQIFGIYEHRTMSEAVVSLATRVEALEKRLQQPGDIICGTVEAKEFTKIGFPQVVWAAGAPAANLRPDNLPADLPWDGIPPYIGHMYLDMTTNAVKLYFAKGISAISDYIPLN